MMGKFKIAATVAIACATAVLSGCAMPAGPPAPANRVLVSSVVEGGSTQAALYFGGYLYRAADSTPPVVLYFQNNANRIILSLNQKTGECFRTYGLGPSQFKLVANISPTGGVMDAVVEPLNDATACLLDGVKESRYPVPASEASNNMSIPFTYLYSVR